MTGRYLRSHLLQIPNYTHSAVSPGLQVADLVAHLAAHQTDPTDRPELTRWWDRFAPLGNYASGLAYGLKSSRVTLKAV
jgi:hypothetical protein